MCKDSYKPKSPIIGADGNVFNLMGIASCSLKDSDMDAKAKEMCDRVMKCGSYYEAISIMSEYIEPVSAEDMDEDHDNGFDMEM